MSTKYEHERYNRKNFPLFVCHHGNWDIYRNERGYCAAIPNEQGEAMGCHASQFGDVQYVKTTLGVDAR